MQNSRFYVYWRHHYSLMAFNCWQISVDVHVGPLIQWDNKKYQVEKKTVKNT